MQFANFVREVNIILSDGVSEDLPFHNAEIDGDRLVPLEISSTTGLIIANNCCSKIEINLKDKVVTSLQQIYSDYVNEHSELEHDSHFIPRFTESLSDSECIGIRHLDTQSRLLFSAIESAWSYESPLGLECYDKEHEKDSSKLPLEKVLRKYWQQCLRANCLCSETSFEYLGFAYSEEVTFEIGSMGEVTWNPSSPIDDILTGEDHIVEFLHKFYEHAVRRRGDYIMATPEGPFLPDTLSNPYVIRWLIEYSYGNLGEEITIRGELPDLEDVGL